MSEMMHAIWWCLFLTLVCVVSEALRWRRLARLTERIDEQTRRLDAQVDRGESHERVSKVEEKLGELDERCTVQFNAIRHLPGGDAALDGAEAGAL